MNESRLTEAQDPRAQRAQYWDLWARYRAAPPGDGKQQQLREATQMRQAFVQAYADTTLDRLLRAQGTFEEELTWFWFNHFNVFWPKDQIGMALPDYVESAIRPHVQGRFGDMLLATMTHPAMLMYLDNVQNIAHRINENQARELLELHTLGVGGGYSQTDVQQVARVLTGLGVHNFPAVGSAEDAPSRDRFRFYPQRHDTGTKEVLGRTIVPGGQDEAGALAGLLAAHPATARHVARRLCIWFVADEPDDKLVASVASVFQASGGNLREVTAAVRQAMNRPGGRADRFKDPLRYVVSSVRLLAEGRPLANVQPVGRWLTALGEPLFRRSTPDGYPLRGREWISPGHLTRRFEVARQMAIQVPRLAGGAGDGLRGNEGLRRLEQSMPEPLRQVVQQATEPVEWAALLLSSPNHMHW